ncbi:hypothetical protein [Polluticoccus soli]|uniref:hypothetical protein n=1 Tax=Polluticoccus soli TaxID=3034150 RepID=UPI0023E142E0|nr:hypothetical protein [Flavipsychrobacter sp. JY13-12]
MKKVLLFFAFTALGIGMVNDSYAQRGKIGLGLRATPDGGGFTGKFFIDPNLAIEAQMNAGGVFGLEGESFNVVGLAEYHITLPDPSWRIFFGGGMHFGVWDRGRWYSNREGRWVDDHEGIFGIDGIGGVEYNFKNIPLGLSADFKPAINFLSDVDFFPHNMFGVAGRFYLNR